MYAMVNRLGRGCSMGQGHDAGRLAGLALLGLALLAPLVTFAPTTAMSATALAGEWSGEGTVTKTEGPTEKVRCRVSYRQESAKIFGVVAQCASTSNKMKQTGELLEVRPGVYTGEFKLMEYDVSGRVRVVIDGEDSETQTVTFKSRKGEGEVILKRR
ncbi:hypothetical protein [Methyloceanibacter methanicus]|nr:hypothetical protein [Methyloceanibacter methanicus]